MVLLIYFMTKMSVQTVKKQKAEACGIKVVSHLWRWSLRHVKFDAWVQRNPITLTASSWRSNLTPPPWAWASSWRKRQISWTYPTCKTSVKLNAQAPKADASQSWNNWTSASRQIGNLMLCSLLYSAFKLGFLSSLALSCSNIYPNHLI